MAARVDLLRAKVEEERLRESLDRFIQERKKKKSRELSPPADKRERCEKEAKKVKLHHHHQHQHQHAEHRAHQLQQNPKPHNFSAGKHVLHSHKHSHHHHHHHHHHSISNGAKKSLQPSLPPPPPPTPPPPPPPPPPPQRKVPEQLQKKRAVPPEPPALFTFTPLKMVKAKAPEFKEKHREKDVKLRPKKENTEANVKHAELKKNKGECREHSRDPTSHERSSVIVDVIDFFF